MCVFKTIIPFTIFKTASQIREFFCISAQRMLLFLIWKQELAWVFEFPRAVALEQSKTCLRWHAECNTDTFISQWTGQTLGSVLGKDGQGQKQKGPTEVSSGSCKEQNLCGRRQKEARILFCQWPAITSEKAILSGFLFFLSMKWISNT